MTLCYLQFNSGTPDPDGYACPSFRVAKEEFRDAASTLYQFGQKLEAYVYLHTDAPGDYPDYILSYTKRGIRVERA